MPGVRRRILLQVAAGLVPAAARARATRLVSLGGAVTETVYALGAGSLLAGADLSSDFPAAAARLPKVGYVRALGAEGMLSLAPDLVLASPDAGPPSVLEQVAAAGVRVVRLPEAHAPQPALERIERIGAALDRTPAARAMVTAIAGDLAQVQGEVAASAARPRVLFLLSAGRGAPMASGTGTAAAAMIGLAGGVNAADAFAQYRPLSPEALLLASPDLVLTTSQMLNGVGGEAGLRATLPGLGDGVRIAAFDTLFLLGFGPRLAQAVQQLAAALHPRLPRRPLPARAWAGE